MDPLEQLIQEIQSYHPNLDADLIRLAYRFASRAHSGQKRRSGEDYIIHPLGVARVLASLQLDLTTIVAGLLHDVVEDTDIHLEEISKHFGEEVALLVDG
ncbi:MAG TPA: bifunctional (p)ppGpp synthetase/guanosine-3',5'-bis(diphosphate) 3'-pyrophosphohydrolase, partial [Clostridia bacterium]|nr:bifunctional (p)ppGpp synthetase/guanosine-3',5'-bis(diphosphate) 3'-pyrophosphohydrolase [Clostridia bacterium]